MPLINNYYGGGSTPQLCKQVDNFKVVIAPGLKALLTWSAPTKDEDNSFVGARIVRKIGSAPINVNDGTVVYEGTKLNYTDTDLIEGTTYYYRAFAYNIKTAYQTAMRVVRIVARSISTVLNENAWDAIRSISDAGQGENYGSKAHFNGILFSLCSGPLRWHGAVLSVRSRAAPAGGADHCLYGKRDRYRGGNSVACPKTGAGAHGAASDI